LAISNCTFDIFAATIHIWRISRMGRECSTKGEKIYRLLVGKSDGNRPLGRPRRRWEDDVKFDLREIEWGGVDWIGLA
jgi:hypothetical protein